MTIYDNYITRNRDEEDKTMSVLSRWTVMKLTLCKWSVTKDSKQFSEGEDLIYKGREFHKEVTEGMKEFEEEFVFENGTERVRESNEWKAKSMKV